MRRKKSALGISNKTWALLASGRQARPGQPGSQHPFTHLLLLLSENCGAKLKASDLASPFFFFCCCLLFLLLHTQDIFPSFFFTLLFQRAGQSESGLRSGCALIGWLWLPRKRCCCRRRLHTLCVAGMSASGRTERASTSPVVRRRQWYLVLHAAEQSWGHAEGPYMGVEGVTGCLSPIFTSSGPQGSFLKSKIKKSSSDTGRPNCSQTFKFAFLITINWDMIDGNVKSLFEEDLPSNYYLVPADFLATIFRFPADLYNCTRDMEWIGCCIDFQIIGSKLAKVRYCCRLQPPLPRSLSPGGQEFFCSLSMYFSSEDLPRPAPPARPLGNRDFSENHTSGRAVPKRWVGLNDRSIDLQTCTDEQCDQMVLGKNP